jgi:hypothetical protein
MAALAAEGGSMEEGIRGCHGRLGAAEDGGAGATRVGDGGGGRAGAVRVGVGREEGEERVTGWEGRKEKIMTCRSYGVAVDIEDVYRV